MGFVTICVLLGCCRPVAAAVPATSDGGRGGAIDRQALVTRHNVVLSKPDPLTPLSIGNGEFAFTADITGLQTFPEYHRQGIPLGAYSQWEGLRRLP